MQTTNPLDRLSPLKERLLLVAVTLAYASLGYFAVGMATQPARSHELWTSLDRAYPFLPWMVHPYGLVYTAALFPAFCVADRRFFRRVVLAYVVVLTASFACYLAFPVTSLHLRVPAASLDTRAFDGWALRVIYFLDPPFNLFPSLHLGVAIVATVSAWLVHRGYGIAAGVGALSILASIFTTRQHFTADALCATAIAALACFIAFRGRRPEADAAPAYSWRGPATYLVLHAGFYACFIVLFLAGWAPWAGGALSASAR